MSCMEWLHACRRGNAGVQIRGVGEAQECARAHGMRKQRFRSKRRKEAGSVSGSERERRLLFGDVMSAAGISLAALRQADLRFQTIIHTS